MRAGFAATAAAFLLAGCGGAAEPTAAEENRTSTAVTPSGLDGADTTGDRTDSLRYGEQAVGGDSRVDQIGTGSGSPSDGGEIEGGAQNPDAAAPAR